MDFINGDTDGIQTFANSMLPPNPAKVTSNMEPSTCLGQMVGCKVFMERDLAAYDEMAKFLTDVAQGMAAYEQIAEACIADYLRGDGDSVQGVVDRVHLAADPALDDMAAAYEAGRPTTLRVQPHRLY